MTELIYLLCAFSYERKIKANPSGNSSIKMQLVRVHEVHAVTTIKPIDLVSIKMSPVVQ